MKFTSENINFHCTYRAHFTIVAKLICHLRKDSLSESVILLKFVAYYSFLFIIIFSKNRMPIGDLDELYEGEISKHQSEIEGRRFFVKRIGPINRPG